MFLSLHRSKLEITVFMRLLVLYCIFPPGKCWPAPSPSYLPFITGTELRPSQVCLFPIFTQQRSKETEGTFLPPILDLVVEWFTWPHCMKGLLLEPFPPPTPSLDLSGRHGAGERVCTPFYLQATAQDPAKVGARKDTC